MYVKDSGELLIHGKTVEAKSVFEMKKKGVDVIYQEFALAPDCTVARKYLYESSRRTGPGVL